jgi:hypothetical protein
MAGAPGTPPTPTSKSATPALLALGWLGAGAGAWARRQEQLHAIERCCMLNPVLLCTSVPACCSSLARATQKDYIVHIGKSKFTLRAFPGVVEVPRPQRGECRALMMHMHAEGGLCMCRVVLLCCTEREHGLHHCVPPFNISGLGGPPAAAAAMAAAKPVSSSAGASLAEGGVVVAAAEAQPRPAMHP